jgi:hypothetical protein
MAAGGRVSRKKKGLFSERDPGDPGLEGGLGGAKPRLEKCLRGTADIAAETMSESISGPRRVAALQGFAGFPPETTFKEPVAAAVEDHPFL